jgi:hypothetical protein
MPRSAVLLVLALAASASAPAAERPSACPAASGDPDPVAALEIQDLRRRIVALEERVEGIEHDLSKQSRIQEDRP